MLTKDQRAKEAAASTAAQAIARRHSSSVAIADALNPSRGIRDDISRRGGTPKDHVRENVARMRRIQEESRQKLAMREHEAARANYVPPALKYEHVPSRLHSTGSRQLGPSAADSDLGCTQIKTPGRSAASSQAKSAPEPAFPSTLMSRQELPSRKTPKGIVPSYLVARKEQWAKNEQEQKQRKFEKETWPAGTVPLPDNERKAVLQKLLEAQKSLHLELSKFPITLQPSNIQRYRRKQDVEERLGEIERGIEKYSRKQVFVPKE